MGTHVLRFTSNTFNFSGSIDDSKSIVNRLLIIQSFFNTMNLDFRSTADDVQFLNSALSDFLEGKTEFDIGAGGTSLRFFLGRLSRTPGKYTIKANSKLLLRPQADLYQALKTVGTDVDPYSQHLQVNVRGWGDCKSVTIKSDVSSQYASAILLNCWNLENVFSINLGSKISSESFLDLTKNICRDLGMTFKSENNVISVAPMQKVNASSINSEVDASSVFTLACFAMLFGKVRIFPYQNKFGQPDFQFLNFLKEWGLTYSLDQDGFSISKQNLNQSVQVNIQDSPDLFPVLCAWLAFNPGTHKIHGAPHLVNKESDRISKTYELLSLAGIQCEKLPDGMIVQGLSRPKTNSFKFDPDNDHRMAFAAALFGFAGFQVELLDKDVVNKSFPHFWSILGLVDDSH